VIDEAQLEAWEKAYGKIGVVDFSGHRVAFRRPTRLEAREYRRALDTPAERPDALDQLAQKTILGLDELVDANAAREAFTGGFLVAFPMAMNHDRFKAVLGLLSGIVDEEEAKDLGKGASVRGLSPPASPKV
jgi:hypothetical protein